MSGQTENGIGRFGQHLFCHGGYAVHLVILCHVGLGTSRQALLLMFPYRRVTHQARQKNNLVDRHASIRLLSHTRAGMCTLPSNNHLAVRINAALAMVTFDPSRTRFICVLSSPVGCSIPRTGVLPSGSWATPSHTVPGSTAAEAALTAASTPIDAWQRCGIKLRVFSAPP